MAELELVLRFAGDEYTAVLDVTWQVVDDSFDHAFGTQHDSHWAPEDYDVITVLDAEGEEIDEFSVPGLTRAIRDALHDYDYQP